MGLKVAAAAEFSEDADERRAAPRHLTILRVGLLRQEHSEDLCLLKNISAGGLMARVHRKLAVGQEVEVELKSEQVLQGSVVWARAGNVGIAFRQPIDVASILAGEAALPEGRRPRLPRIHVRCPLRVRLGAHSRAGYLCDISPGGAKIQIGSAVQEHENAVLTLADLPPIEGVVRWVRNGHAGVAFNTPLPFETLAQWLAARASTDELLHARAPRRVDPGLREREPSDCLAGSA